MNPEEEWEHEEKLEQLSCRLEELLLTLFIGIVEKLIDRNQPIAQSTSNYAEDEVKF